MDQAKLCSFKEIEMWVQHLTKEHSHPDLPRWHCSRSLNVTSRCSSELPFSSGSFASRARSMSAYLLMFKCSPEKTCHTDRDWRAEQSLESHSFFLCGDRDSVEAMRIALAACHTHSSSTVCERSFSKTNIVLSGSARARKLRGWEIASTEWIVFFGSIFPGHCQVSRDWWHTNAAKEKRREKNRDKHRNLTQNQETPANHDPCPEKRRQNGDEHRNQRIEKKGDEHRNSSRKQD